MYILSLHIREFGGLSDLSLTFSEGLNLITGENEAGKSTVIAFIRFMLYGLPKRRAGEALSDGDRAFSWANGIADGSMTVRKNDKIYRIERREQSDSPRRLLQIVDEATGQPLPKGETPEALLLGFPAEVFDSTACIRQLRAGEIDGEGLSGAIENLLLAGDESVNTEKVLKALDKARVTLLHKNGHGGDIYRIESEISALSARLDRMRADADALAAAKEESAELKEEIRSASKALEDAETACRLLSDAEILSRFDALHADEARLKRMKAIAEESAERHTRNGFLPDENYVRTLESHAVRLDADERNLLRCDAEHRIASETAAPDPSLLASAKAVRELGGRSVILTRLEELERQIRAASRLPKLFFPIGALLLLVGILLAVLVSPALALLSLGALASIPGFIGLTKKKRALSARAALLTAICNPPPPSSAELSRLIDRATNAEAKENECIARLETAEKALAEALELKKAHEAEAARDAYRVLPFGSDINAAVLRETARSISEENAVRELAVTTASVFEKSYRSAASALEAYDEDTLRAGLPHGYDYKNRESASAAEERRDRAKETISTLESKRLEAERRRSALEATVGSPEKTLREIEEKTAEKGRLEAKLRAILLAHESIASAREGLKSRISPRLRADASAYLSVLSGGRYDSLSLDKAFALSAEENGRVHTVDAFSGGTKDAMYLSLRFALSDLVGGKDALPLLLDEALAQLDDTRASALLSLLLTRAESGGQSLAFTCHSRESRLLDGTGANLIRLSRKA